MRTTIKDVAKIAGVSFKTVSRVVNNEPSVKESLQKKVREAIATLNYQPNQSARTLRGTATSIAFIYDNPNNNYIIEMQNGILKECRKQFFELVIHPCDSKSGTVCEELLELVQRGRVGGLILTPPLSETDSVVNFLLGHSIQFVRILSGSEAPDDLSPSVFIDDRKAAFDITKYLVELGHNKINFLCGDPEHKSNSERVEGYKSALVDNHIAVDPKLILEGEFSFDSGVERTKQVLRKAERSSAIFACNDEIAAGALFAARMSGIAVPQELSIVGFEDSPFSRQTWPKLTTAMQPNKAIAQSAANLLIDHIRASNSEREEGGAVAVGFYPELIVRDSTCPAG